jgi:hypothetical protein
MAGYAYICLPDRRLAAVALAAMLAIRWCT